MFFECNLPKIAPEHIRGGDARKNLSDILLRVHARMEILEDALHVSGLRGEDFSFALAPLFQRDVERQPIDAMSVDDLANAAMLLSRGKTRQPDRYEWPNAVVLVDTAWLSRYEWEQIRKLGLGGSDAAIVDGLSPYRTAQDLFYDKTGAPVKRSGRDTGKEFIFSYGHKLESLVVDEFCRRTGATVVPEPRMFAKRGAEFMTANIDAIVKLPSGDIYVFEAKTTTFFNKDAWDGGKVPRHYIPQCLQYPNVLDDPRVRGTYIGCIYGNTPNDFFCSRVELDMTELQAQTDRERKFWETHIVGNVVPPKSGDPAQDLETLKIFGFGPANKNNDPVKFSSFDTSVLERARTWLDLNEKLSTAKKMVENLEEARNAASISLIERLGESVTGTLPLDDENYLEISYAPRARTSVDNERLRLSYPEAYEACVTTNPESFRVFAVKEKRVRKAKAV